MTERMHKPATVRVDARAGVRASAVWTPCAPVVALHGNQIPQEGGAP